MSIAAANSGGCRSVAARPLPAVPLVKTCSPSQRFSQFRNGGYPSCSSLARSFLPSVSSSAPRNIFKHARVCQEHNAFIGFLGHDEMCDGCSCKNPVLFSDCQQSMLTLNVRCASPSFFNRFRSPCIKRLTAEFDNCGKLLITTIGFHSFSVARHLGGPANSWRLQPVLRSRTYSGACRTS